VYCISVSALNIGRIDWSGLPTVVVELDAVGKRLVLGSKQGSLVFQELPFGPIVQLLFFPPLITIIITLANAASVVQLARTSSITRVVMSSSPDWSEFFSNFLHHLWLLLIIGTVLFYLFCSCTKPTKRKTTSPIICVWSKKCAWYLH